MPAYAGMYFTSAKRRHFGSPIATRNDKARIASLIARLVECAANNCVQRWSWDVTIELGRPRPRAAAGWWGMAAKDVDAAGSIDRRKRDGRDQGRQRSHAKPAGLGASPGTR
ncbi:hypothetical protein [Bradyrhizobium sp. 25ACV]